MIDEDDRRKRIRDTSAGPRDILERMAAFGTVLAIKLYRLPIVPPVPLPTLPCLDHEAMLHQNIPPHMAAYVRAADTGSLHELVFIPSRLRIDIDTISTWGEATPESHDRLASTLASTFPGWQVRSIRPSWWRGDRRVAEACRAQVPLREVLLADDVASVTMRIQRLQTIAALMEKESRVASWGVRTVSGPLLPAAALLAYFALSWLAPPFGPTVVTALRYLIVALVGATFLYYGLKAVQLTDMSNRVWKRTAEYSLILQERKRLADERHPARS